MKSKNVGFGLDRTEKAITLVALVITMIVMLILAGISFSLVMGENGIIDKAINARNMHNLSIAEEQIALKAADYGGEYYIRIYKDRDLEEDNGVCDYIAERLNGTVDDYAFSTEGDRIIIKKDGELQVIGRIQDDGAIDWNGASGGVLEVIKNATYYGDYVDLGTNILNLSSITLEDGTQPKADWRVFSKDSTGVWLILSDYFPASTYLNSSGNNFITDTIGLQLASDTSTYPYAVRSTTNRADLIDKLSADWTGLLASSTIAGKTGVTAKGAFTVTEWQESWNSKYTGEEGITVSDNGNGSFYSLDISSKVGYNNTLYFPYKGDKLNSNCYGYWLASIYANSVDNEMNISWGGYVNSGRYYFDYCCVRPAVYLPSSINIKQNSTTGVWTVIN